MLTLLANVTVVNTDAVPCNVDDSINLAIKAMDHIFGPHANGSAISDLISRCKAARLADIAPAVFVPEYPRILISQQKLIPIIAQCLFGYHKRPSVITKDVADKNEICTDRQAHSRGWFQEKLWSCMLATVKQPTGVRKRYGAPTKSDIISDRFNRPVQALYVSPVGEDDRVEQCLREEDGDDFLIWEAEDDPTGPLLFDLYEATLEGSLEESEVQCDVTEDVSESPCRLQLSADAGGFIASIPSLGPDESGHAQAKGWSTGLTSRTSPDKTDGASEHASYPKQGFANIHKRCERPQAVIESPKTREPVGQGPLSDHACSSWVEVANRFEIPSDDMFESMHIPHNVESSINNPASVRLIDTGHEPQDLLFFHNQSSEVFAAQNGRHVSSQMTDMLHRPEIQVVVGQESRALCEVLDNDQFSWHTQEQRKHTSLSAENEMLEKHPEVDIVSTTKPCRRESADPMLFDSFTFSRKLFRHEATSPHCSAEEYFDSFLA